MAKTTTKRAVYRSAKTGRFVTEAFAKRHPGTTVRQSIKEGACRPAPTRKPA